MLANEGGTVKSGSGGASLEHIARTAQLRMEALRDGVEPLLTVTGTYQPGIDTGEFTFVAHAAVVAVDPATGAVEILDDAVAEDCGTMINPMMVEGQVRGGVIQGIGTALYEEIPHDNAGQPAGGKLRRLPDTGHGRDGDDQGRPYHDANGSAHCAGNAGL